MAGRQNAPLLGCPKLKLLPAGGEVRSIVDRRGCDMDIEKPPTMV